MTKLLTALLIGALSLSANAESIRRQERNTSQINTGSIINKNEAEQFCDVMLTDPMMVTQIKLYTTATTRGLEHNYARAAVEEFVGLQQMGGMLPIRDGIFSRYFWDLDGEKDVETVTAKIKANCVNTLVAITK